MINFLFDWVVIRLSHEHEIVSVGFENSLMENQMQHLFRLLVSSSAAKFQISTGAITKYSGEITKNLWTHK